MSKRMSYQEYARKQRRLELKRRRRQVEDPRIHMVDDDDDVAIVAAPTQRRNTPECIICYNHVKHPGRLDCGHDKFCTTCLKEMMVKRTGRSIKCPLCRQKSERFYNNKTKKYVRCGDFQRHRHHQRFSEEANQETLIHMQRVIMAQIHQRIQGQRENLRRLLEEEDEEEDPPSVPVGSFEEVRRLATQDSDSETSTEEEAEAPRRRRRPVRIRLEARRVTNRPRQRHLTRAERRRRRKKKKRAQIVVHVDE